MKKGVHVWDSVDVLYGLPLAPITLSPVLDTPPVRLRGDAEAPWGQRVYTDDSLLCSGGPGLGRRGWAVVELGPKGLPVRARFGGLRGRAQTVPRFERFVMYQALRVCPRNVHVVSDHSSAVQEGQAWDKAQAASGGQHADIWRDLFDLYSLEGALPTFEWTPSHRIWDDVVASGSEVEVQC